MKKLLVAVMCIALVPMLFAVDIADDNPPEDAIRTENYDPNAMTNPLPSNGPVQIDDGRALGDILMTIDLAAIGMPGDGYDNGGLTWDGQYLYVDNMYNNNIYIVDPTGPTLVGNFAAPPTLSWGIGHEQNLWITEVYAFNAYEYTYAGTPTGNSFYCLQGGASWMGDASEWWPDGEIWILAVGGTNRLYKFSVPAGTYLTDVGDATYTYISQRGLTYDPWNDMFWVGGWNSDMVWEANASDGSVTGRSFPFLSIASLAYDWQSTLHPEPVLWLASNDAANYIYMIDPDNPQPVTSIVWDFEDGWQGWIHTNGMSFPAAWERKEFDYKSAYAVPSAGDTSMWIDSDAISGTWVQDTALSPVIVPATTMDWLKYGAGYNDVGSGDFYEVGIKYFDGANWTAVPLVTYTADFYGMWDSVDVSAYAGYDYVQVYFYYDDADTWAWYAVFDNVTIAGTIPSAHDVGCNMITSPPAGDLIPAGNYDVIGNIKNFGDFAETFDATAEVWDTTTWTQVFTQTATFTDFPAGAESLHTFGNVTFETDKVYYTMIYTELVDDDPANDTSSIYSNTIIPNQYWEILDPPLYPIPGAGMSEATLHDGYYYMFGVRNGATYIDTILVYDIANNQWLDGGDNPFGPGSYGTANAVNGRFYRVGGTNAFPTPLSRIDILEPPSTWTAGATPPVGFLDQMTGVYNDSLLFVFGGGNWSMTPTTDVYFYDTYLDSWTSATSFPAPGCGAMAGGVIDSFAILAFGYKGSAAAYDNTYIVGIIDQTDPTNITWGSWAPVPGGAIGCRRVPSGVDEFNGELWVIGGQISGGQLDRTLSYDPYTDTWTDWNMPKPQSVCNITPLVITTTTMGDLGVFVGGGYASGIYLSDHEVFHTGNYTGIAENPGQQGTSSRFGFAPSMPNPTKSYAAISYTTTTSGPVSVHMYDGAGRLVKTLVDRVIEPAGTKTVYWNGKDDARRDIPNGVYFLRLEAEGQVDTHKMIFVR